MKAMSNGQSFRGVRQGAVPPREAASYEREIPSLPPLAPDSYRQLMGILARLESRVEALGTGLHELRELSSGSTASKDYYSTVEVAKLLANAPTRCVSGVAWAELGRPRPIWGVVSKRNGVFRTMSLCLFKMRGSFPFLGLA